MKKFLVLAAWAAMASSLWAASQTVTLSVPDMNCAACPITVKTALSRVSGVGKIDIDLERREVRVTFDDAKTHIDALTHATRDAGYPSRMLGTPQ